MDNARNAGTGSVYAVACSDGDRLPLHRVVTPEEFARAYGSQERVEWVREQPCVVRECQGYISQNAHVKTGGTSRKGDADKIVPACPTHHGEMHRGQQSFEAKYGLDLAALAAETEARWRTHERHREPLPW